MTKPETKRVTVAMKSALTPEELAEAKAVCADIDMKLKSDLLRHKIEIEIRMFRQEPDRAALAVCVLLEREIGLAGNGWFDGDDETLDAIAADGR